MHSYYSTTLPSKQQLHISLQPLPNPPARTSTTLDQIISTLLNRTLAEELSNSLLQLPESVAVEEVLEV
ncbi:hypothetical protein HK097_001428, partial [Rhizophlyctis rosea]